MDSEAPEGAEHPVSAEPTLAEVMGAVNRVANKLDLRDDSADMLRKTLEQIGGMREEFRRTMRRTSKKIELLEQRVDWLERKAGK